MIGSFQRKGFCKFVAVNRKHRHLYINDSIKVNYGCKIKAEHKNKSDGVVFRFRYLSHKATDRCQLFLKNPNFEFQNLYDINYLRWCRKYFHSTSTLNTQGDENTSSKITKNMKSSSQNNDADYCISQIRNIGISAHIDSGKTTLTERILYYTGRIRAIHEVRGSDGIGAKMDSMELEREKGITIQSAATYCRWRYKNLGVNSCDKGNDITNPDEFDESVINIIDTPGHVDFTIEVERALRVLDSAILVCCGVSAVQSQTLTVNRQMNRYNIPRLIFINKLDRDGADPDRAINLIEKKLNLNVVAIQIPIGLEGRHKGVIDIIKKKSYFFLGKNGETRVEEDVDVEYKEKLINARNLLLEKLADADETFGELYIQDEYSCSEQDIICALRRTTINRTLIPVLMGSAKANKGVQNLLDAVCLYLPCPDEVTATGFDQDDNNKEVFLLPDIKKPFVGYAFKIQDLPIGQISYLRIYQGSIKKNDAVLNISSGKKVNIKKIYKMHSDEAKECKAAFAGEIVAIGGIDCNTGTTFTDGKLHIALSSMYIPDPVVSLSVRSTRREDLSRFSKAIARFQREDPTFKIHVDEESKETIMSGMGELHLLIYLERMKREYNIELNYGEPRVNFRETVTQRAYFDYTHKKQTGGAGQYGKVVGYFEPIIQDFYETNTATGEFNLEKIEFINKLVGNDIPPNYIASIEKGFRESCLKGMLSGHNVINIRFVLTGGNSHEVDSSDLAFRTAASGAFREFYESSCPIVLEPIMKVDVYLSVEFQANGISSINKRKGNINSTTIDGEMINISAEVALKDMFGYINDLRSCTQGQGEFSMEFLRYQPMNSVDQEAIIRKYQELKNKK